MLVTVITINYNDYKGLRRTIESVVGQTWADLEFVVIDGGSTDGSVEVIKEHQQQISYWVSEKDRGIYHAMNKGVAEAHGEYCIFMNAGDSFCHPTVLEQMQPAMAEGSDIIVGQAVTDDSGSLISPPPSRPISLYHLYSGAIPHQAALIKTSLLHSHPYDESLRIAADWKFFLQTIIIGNCTVQYLNLPVARYDLGGVSSQNPEKMRAEKELVLSLLFPPRVLADMQWMKQSECLTQTLTPQLRIHYGIDKMLYRLGRALLKLRR